MNSPKEENSTTELKQLEAQLVNLTQKLARLEEEKLELEREIEVKKEEGQRQCIVAHYERDSVFKVPKGVNLKKDVLEWRVKNDILHITYHDGREETIQPTIALNGVGLLWPNDVEVKPYTERFEESDSEDDDEEQKKEEERTLWEKIRSIVI